MMRRLAFVLVLVWLAQAAAWAQECQPQRIVVLSAAGGGADGMARVIAQRLSIRFNRNVIVENRGGAGGNLAADHVLKSPKDGCTLLLTGNNFTLNPHVYARAGYETKDFAAVHHGADANLLLVAAANQPFKTLLEMVAYARNNPGRLQYGSSGIGTPNHISMELLLKAAQIKVDHVPYKGGAPAMADTMSGVLPMSVGSVAASAAFVASGKVIPLAVTGPTRYPTLPNVPTMVESGFPSASLLAWTGFLASAGTPIAAVQRYNRELDAVLQEPEVREALLKLGYQPALGTAEEFAKFLVEDEAINRRMAEELKLRVE
jgi:tripartite-type tricarboxylate transporter receptor subunit TctC